MITIISSGAYSTIQDGGRIGWGHLGVPRAGAMDPLALAQANRLVGNAQDSAAIEFLMGGVAVRFDAPASFALTGAPVAAYLDSVPIALNSWTYARAGAVLTTGRPVYGLWSYLAVSGGIDVSPVLSSRSTDSLSGLGPPPVASNSCYSIGPVRGVPATPSDVFVENASASRHLHVGFDWGPRDDWFTDQSRQAFQTARWQVSSETNRIAARLLGPALVYRETRHLPTEGIHPGSIQVPPSGQPLVFLANYPPTGGYPVIGVLHEADVGRVAQAAPGTLVSMHASRTDKRLHQVALR